MIEARIPANKDGDQRAYPQRDMVYFKKKVLKKPTLNGLYLFCLVLSFTFGRVVCCKIKTDAKC